MEPARHETSREPDVFLSLDGVFVGGLRSAIQRHSAAGPHGHNGENMPRVRFSLDQALLGTFMGVEVLLDVPVPLPWK